MSIFRVLNSVKHQSSLPSWRRHRFSKEVSGNQWIQSNSIYSTNIVLTFYSTIFVLVASSEARELLQEDWKQSRHPSSGRHGVLGLRGDHQAHRQRCQRQQEGGASPATFSSPSAKMKSRKIICTVWPSHAQGGIRLNHTCDFLRGCQHQASRRPKAAVSAKCKISTWWVQFT